MEGSVQMQLISREMMKTSSQTSHRFKNLKLSYLDRSLPSLYVPLIFFYNADESVGLTTSNHLQISQRFKLSLLDILPSFYPLAGSVKHNFTVDCNGGAGVEFVEAKAHAHLKNVVQESTVEEMKSYLPSECTTFDHARRPPLVVQITFFDCGGLAVAVGISHKIADFASAMVFVAAWVAKCRGGGEPEFSRLNLGTSPYFPALRGVPFSLFTKLFKSSAEFVTKRFVFDKEKLEILRRAATSASESATKDPTRVELVSAFIWKHFMEARSKTLQERKFFAALIAVNLRPRTTPPGILDGVFGNCFMSPLAFADESSGKFHHLVTRLRRSIRRVRGGYITKLIHKESYAKDLVKLAVLLLAGKLEWCYFTSWRGFEMYEVDYGWGKPVWFGTPSMPIKNLVVLVSSKSGDDVEAIVTMKQEVVQMIEAQINLISTKNGKD